MRGCLFVLVIAAVFALAASTLAGPPIAAGLVRAGLAATGFEAARTDVDIAADPPWELLTGHADRVRIRATNASVDALTVSRLDLALTGVDLIGRRADRVAGTLTGVTVTNGTASIAVDEISVDGPASRAAARVTIPASSLVPLASRVIEAKVGAAPGDLRLVEPDRLAFAVAGRSAEAVLSVSSGGDVVATISTAGVGAVQLIDAAALRPLQVTGVSVRGGALDLTGSLDLATLLR